MSTAFETLIRQLPQMFDAARAQRTLESIASHAGEGAARDLFAAAASNSPFLARALVQECAFLPELRAVAPDDAFAAIIAHVEGGEAQARGEVLALLRQAKRRAALLIAVADLGGMWSLDEVTGALTKLR